MYDTYLNSGTLAVEGLVLSRGETVLLNGLSMTVAPGDLVWVSGSNGIGKTTLLKCIAGLIRQDSGNVNWNPSNTSHTDGFAVYQGHSDGHKSALSVEEILAFWHDLYGSNLNLESVLKRVGLATMRNLKARHLSAGQSRRLVLARMIIKNAPLWIMDEPMAAMDKAGRDLIFDLLGEHVRKKGSILLASHGVPNRIGQNARHLLLKRADHARD